MLGGFYNLPNIVLSKKIYGHRKQTSVSLGRSGRAGKKKLGNSLRRLEGDGYACSCAAAAGDTVHSSVKIHHIVSFTDLISS